ncbi:GntR family transcriptional regulator [Actinomadura vinacea]|uniref:GntR family transcriptional regulator n=1 Tax=Actinomadura vinacea TaxID=115336 RepID=A0ABN3K169_9ACTN
MTAERPSRAADAVIARWAATLTVQAGPRRRAAREHAVAELRAAISEGVLPPGAEIPEQAAAEALGTSRNTLREAFRVLFHDGLLEHRDHRGVIVRRLRAEDIVDIYNARILLECGALEAAHRAPSERVDLIRQAAAAGLAALPGRDPQELRRCGMAFHLSVVALARSRLVSAFADTLFTQLQLAYHQTRDPAEFHASFIERNVVIADRLGEGEFGEAADAMRQYLRDAQAQLLTSIAMPH